MTNRPAAVALADAVDRIRHFVDHHVIPAEREGLANLTDSVRLRLQEQAKATGIFGPHLPRELGGHGWSLPELAMLLEEAGRSLLGPLALGAAAPDEGNVHLLSKVATPAQRERYLEPLAAGAVRSCFAMTEPAPGVGSDPRAVTTAATRVAGGWSMSGEKHLITGADGAAFGIVMARTGDAPADVTMFLVCADNPGWTVTGHHPTMDVSMVGGHCRVTLADCLVSDEDVLGEVGQGLRYAQLRLAPARLTHCMRWLGAARRTHEIALQRAVDREIFGRALTRHGMAQALIADNEIELHASRALLAQAAADVDADHEALIASSRCKVFVSEATCRVVDRSVQLMGGLGTDYDHIVARVYADIRAFRIYDGASEVHRMSIAKRAVGRLQASPQSYARRDPR